MIQPVQNLIVVNNGASETGGSVILSWNLPSDPERDLIRVFKNNTELITELLPSDTTITIFGLTNGVSVIFSVVTVNLGPPETSATVISDPIIPTDANPPSPPDNFRGFPINRGARFIWNANSEPDISHYIIRWGFQSGIYLFSKNVGNVTQFDLEGLEPGLVTFFVLQAVDTSNNASPNSAEITVRIPSLDPVTFVPQEPVSYFQSLEDRLDGNPSIWWTIPTLEFGSPDPEDMWVEGILDTEKLQVSETKIRGSGDTDFLSIDVTATEIIEIKDEDENIFREGLDVIIVGGKQLKWIGERPQTGKIYTVTFLTIGLSENSIEFSTRNFQRLKGFGGTVLSLASLIKEEQTPFFVKSFRKENELRIEWYKTEEDMNSSSNLYALTSFTGNDIDFHIVRIGDIIRLKDNEVIGSVKGRIGGSGHIVQPVFFKFIPLLNPVILINRGNTAGLAKLNLGPRLDRKEKIFLCSIKFVSDGFETLFSEVFKIVIPPNRSIELAERAMEILPDEKVYDKDDLKRPISERKTNLWNVMLVMGIQHDITLATADAIIDDLDIRKTRDDRLDSIHGREIGISQLKLNLLDYRHLLKVAFKKLRMAGTVDGIKSHVSTMTGIRPTIQSIRNNINTWIMGTGDPSFDDFIGAHAVADFNDPLGVPEFVAVPFSRSMLAAGVTINILNPFGFPLEENILKLLIRRLTPAHIWVTDIIIGTDLFTEDVHVFADDDNIASRHGRFIEGRYDHSVFA